MPLKHYAVIIGTGSFIPTRVFKDENFLTHEFFDPEGKRIEKSNTEIIQKFEEITGIKERRYVADDIVTSDIAYFAARDALESSQVDKESLDCIVVAHNFGDIRSDNKKSDFVPSLASRTKHKLKISNPKTIAFDLPFGCPGWLQGIIHADSFIKAGAYKRILVIGAETLSRVSDPHDRDSMIYADGAGATIIEARESQEPTGVIAFAARTDALDHAYMLWMDKSSNPEYPGDELYLKMHGHKLYEYALRNVPTVVKEALDKAGVKLTEVRKVLIHQANEKMDEAILRRLFKLYQEKDIPPYLMPMTIAWLGNSSVATLPTLLDLLLKGKLNNHNLKTDDIIVFASVGAGMNINAVVYKMP